MRTILNLFCLVACASAIHDHTHIEPQNTWPDIGKIVDKAKNAADDAAKAAEKVNKTVQNTVDQAEQATKMAIETIVETAQTGLQSILEQGKMVNDQTKEAITGYIATVGKSSKLTTFGEAGMKICDAFDTLFEPLVSALHTSSNSVQSVLKATGFLHLSQAIGKDFQEAMVPMNATLKTVKEVKGILGGLKDKVNNTLGKITTEVDKDFKKINQILEKVFDDLNRTFDAKLIEGYDMLVDHLRKTVEGVLPLELMKQVNSSLGIILEPKVSAVSFTVMRPVQTMKEGFETATHNMHEHFPSSAHIGAIFSLPLAISICISWFAL